MNYYYDPSMAQCAPSQTLNAVELLQQTNISGTDRQIVQKIKHSEDPGVNNPYTTGGTWSSKAANDLLRINQKWR